MNTKPRIVGLTSLLIILTSTSAFAVRGIVSVTKERAKELGIQLRAISRGPEEAAIVVEFKPEGELKLFDSVSLEIKDGKQFLLSSGPLQEHRSPSGSVTVTFLVNRQFLEKVVVRIVVGKPGSYDD